MMVMIMIMMGCAPFTYDPFTYRPFYLPVVGKRVGFLSSSSSSSWWWWWGLGWGFPTFFFNIVQLFPFLFSNFPPIFCSSTFPQVFSTFCLPFPTFFFNFFLILFLLLSNFLFSNFSNFLIFSQNVFF